MATAIWRTGPDTAIRTDSSSPEPTASLDALLAPLRTDAPPPEGCRVMDIRLTGEKGGDSAIVVGGDPIVHFYRENQLAPLLEKLVNGFIMNATREAMLLHAALLEWEGAPFLFPADPRSGKSTLSAFLGNRGARYGGDDLVYASYTAPELIPYPKAVTIKHGAFPHFPESPTWVDASRGELRYQHPPNRLEAPVPLAAVRAVVLPQYTAGCTPRLEPLSDELGALILLQQTVGGLERDARNLECIRTLSRLPAFLIEYPDSEAAVDLLASIPPREAPA